MAPGIASAKLTLSYPLYACDFDPNDATRLVVAGGGGAGKNGVGNKISVLDASEPDKLGEIAEAELSKEEDNPTSLAVSKTVSGFTFIYAGVNSSTKDAEKGLNEHFRVYALGKKQKKGSPVIQEVSREQLFVSNDKATYQRLLRLSRPSEKGDQLGVVATGFGNPSKLAIFDTADGKKSSSSRGVIELDKEAEDVDVIQTGPDEYRVAYCDNHNIFLKTISPKAELEDAYSIYDMPDTVGEPEPGSPAPSSFRSLRFLTPNFLAVLINKPARTGSMIRVLRIKLEPTGYIASPVQTLFLPKKVTQATGLAVANLNPPPIAGGVQDNTRFVLAAADQAAISIATMDYQVSSTITLTSPPKLLTRVEDVHPMQITGLAFAPFFPTAKESSTETLRLASVSVGNTVVVQSLPLSFSREKKQYLVALKPARKAPEFGVRNAISVLAIVAIGILLQTILELGGRSPDILGAERRLPTVIRNYLTTREPAHWQRLNEGASSGGAASYEAFADHPVASLLAALRSEAADGQPIVMRPAVGERGADEETEKLATFNAGDEEAAREEIERDIKAGAGGPIDARLHDEEEHGPHGGRTWEELGEEQKKAWERRLREMGHWAGDLPETLFKGVLFSEIAGAVGRGIAGM
ncbi:hypothetical protein V493_02530 [Pseudogymnoascus sp. VKM F-4281 (FW-2241)]|nr:hypothetical protein V493_02530 [Pseudogymnoascus sp. VKM F-4281 (FW-2241)]